MLKSEYFSVFKPQLLSNVVLFSWKKCNLFAYTYSVASIQFYFSSFAVPFFWACVRLCLQSNISSISQIYYFSDKFFFCPLCCCCHCHCRCCCNEFDVRMQFLAVSCYSINSFKLDSWHKLKIGKWINREEEAAAAAKKLVQILRYHRISFYSLSDAKGIHATAWNGGLVSYSRAIPLSLSRSPAASPLWGVFESPSEVSLLNQKEIYAVFLVMHKNIIMNLVLDDGIQKEQQHTYRKWRITPFVKAHQHPIEMHTCTASLVLCLEKLMAN